MSKNDFIEGNKMLLASTKQVSKQAIKSTKALGKAGKNVFRLTQDFRRKSQ